MRKAIILQAAVTVITIFAGIFAISVFSSKQLKQTNKLLPMLQRARIH
jgi:hypothetical protein